MMRSPGRSPFREIITMGGWLLKWQLTAAWAGLCGATASIFAKGRRWGGGVPPSVVAPADWDAWTCSKALAISSMREDKSFRKRIILTRACLTAQMSISARGNPSPSMSGDSRVESFARRIAAWDLISSSMLLFDAISVLRLLVGHCLVEVVMVGWEQGVREQVVERVFFHALITFYYSHIFLAFMWSSLFGFRALVCGGGI